MASILLAMASIHVIFVKEVIFLVVLTETCTMDVPIPSHEDNPSYERCRAINKPLASSRRRTLAVHRVSKRIIRRKMEERLHGITIGRR